MQSQPTPPSNTAARAPLDYAVECTLASRTIRTGRLTLGAAEALAHAFAEHHGVPALLLGSEGEPLFYVTHNARWLSHFEPVT